MNRYNRTQFIASQTILIFVAIIAFMMLQLHQPMFRIAGLLLLLLIVGFNIMAFIRRLHDIGLPGYWAIVALLLSAFGRLLPDEISGCIDMLIVFSFALIPGNKAENAYGLPSKKRWSLI